MSALGLPRSWRGVVECALRGLLPESSYVDGFTHVAIMTSAHGLACEIRCLMDLPTNFRPSAYYLNHPSRMEYIGVLNRLRAIKVGLLVPT